MLEVTRAATRFENDGEKSRLILEYDDSVSVLGFQVDMIRKNKIPGVLPLEVRQANNKAQLFYDISGLWTLKDFLDNHEFTGQEFVGLLEAFIRTLTGADAFLLDLGQFILEEDSIFLNRNLEPTILYLPVKINQDIHKRFKEFLRYLIVDRARIRDTDSGAVLSGIINYLKREDFNIFEFQKAIKDLHNMDHRGKPLPKDEPQVYEPLKPKTLGDFMPNEGNSQAPSPLQQMPKQQPPQMPGKLGGPIETPVPPVPQMPSRPTLSNVQNRSEYKSKVKYKTSVVVTAVVFQVVLVVGLFFLYPVVLKATQDMTTAMAALGLMVLSVDGLLLKNLFKEDNKIEVQVEVKSKKMAHAPQRAPMGTPAMQVPSMKPQVPNISNVPPAQAAPQMNFGKQAVSNAMSVPVGATKDTEVLGGNAMPGSQMSDTVVLTEQARYPYLLRKGPIQEVIQLPKPVMVLGRQADMVDYAIDDPAVGRMHAQITYEHNQFTIRDMNSRNGTFVNGQRLIGPSPIAIQIGDEIKLAHLEYTLVQD